MIIVLNGPLGIGKSTLAEVLSERIEWCVSLDGDHVAVANPPALAALHHVHATLALLVQHHRRFGYRHFVINHIWRTPEELADLWDRLAPLDREIHCFLLTLPVAENVRRIERRASVRAVDEREFERRTFADEHRVLTAQPGSDLGERVDASATPAVLADTILTRVSAHLIHIRAERPDDEEAIADVNRQAFGQEQEGRIVDALRAEGALTLSLVAECNGAIVGHIAFSPSTVGSAVGAALGPVAVLPSFQRRGIGSQLVEQGLARLGEVGCPFVVVVGHPEFYPRFGFFQAADYGLTCEWDVPREVFMVAFLSPGCAGNLTGRATFRPAFSSVE
jgi:predicted N-acetyltransferase YhbS